MWLVNSSVYELGFKKRNKFVQLISNYQNLAFSMVSDVNQIEVGSARQKSHLGGFFYLFLGTGRFWLDLLDFLDCGTKCFRTDRVDSGMGCSDCPVGIPKQCGL